MTTMKCDRCQVQDAASYHRMNRSIWIVYVCGECHAVVTRSPAVTHACPVHHSTSCGCALDTEATP